MTDSLTGPVHHGAEPRRSKDNTPAQDHRKTNDNDLFFELNIVRHLGVSIQDLRPLRGRPPADPGPPRLTGVHPKAVEEETMERQRQTQPT